MIKNLFNSIWMAFLCLIFWDKVEEDNNESVWGEPENPLKMPAEDFWREQAEI